MNKSKGSLHNIYRCKYYFTSDGCFTEGVKALIAAACSQSTPLRLVFFGATQNNETYLCEWNEINRLTKEKFGSHLPAVSYVIQPLAAGGTMAVEAHYIIGVTEEEVCYRTYNNISYLLATVGNCRMLMLGGVMGNGLTSSIEQQSAEAFVTIEEIMNKEGFPGNSIVRQWNYIEQITRQEHDVQRYQAFNDARTIFYRHADWQSHGYPAATGIGTEWGGVMVDLIAVVPIEGKTLTVLPLDNPLQVAAHDYSQQVLLGEKSSKIETRSTPKFERGKVISTTDAFKLCFISGTAAIRGEQSIDQMDIEEQTRITMENINYLISPDNLPKGFHSSPACFFPNNLRVYLKQADDLHAASAVLKTMYKGDETIYLLADVCRDELLIEIEGMATESI